MTSHVSTYHLDLGQLWRCPVSWFSHWKGAPQDCIDHIRLRHHVGLSVKTASLGKWFPPWTVMQLEWCAALMPNVSGIATDAVLFSQHGAWLAHHYRVDDEYVSHCPSGLLAESLLALIRPGRQRMPRRHLPEPRPGLPLRSLSMVPRRHRLCAHFRPTGGDRPCRCRCCYHVLPHRISFWHRILHSRNRTGPVIPIVAGVRVIDPLLRSGRV